MMRDLIPRSLRLLGFGFAPQIAMADLMTPQEPARIGVAPLAGHAVILRFGQGALDVLPFSTRLAALICQDMINVSRDGVVEFCIPTTMATLRSSHLD
ncbi:MAG TPA: hypothetical protein VGS22_25260 [Thermoanaerobaculia bacterium]|nr:hypothetical protein [Thermoanaerobaculia bacterium]